MNGKLVSKAAETAICHADELVQHHSSHVTLRKVGETTSLTKCYFKEVKILFGSVDNIIMWKHHTFRVTSSAWTWKMKMKLSSFLFMNDVVTWGITQHTTLIDSYISQSLIQDGLWGIFTWNINPLHNMNKYFLKIHFSLVLCCEFGRRDDANAWWKSTKVSI